MNISKFLEQNNELVIGGDKVSHYQLILVSTEEVYGTYPSPADEQDILEATADLAVDLPMGRQQFRFQAITDRGIIRAQCNISVEGRAPIQRGGSNNAAEHIHHARAVKANVDVAEQQLTTMAARLQATEGRVQEAEERALSMAKTGFELMDVVNGLVSSKEDNRRKEEEHAAKMQNLRIFGQMFLPMLEPVVKLGTKWVDKKMRDIDNELDSDSRKAAE